MKKKFVSGITLLALLAAFAPLRSFAAGSDLDKVLAQMDTAAAKFKTARADFDWDNYTKVVDDHALQTGTTYFDRSAGAMQMSLDIEKPAKKTVIYKDGKLYFYQPELSQLNIRSAGANRAQYETFLTLGFGGSGKDLAAAWSIADLGPETINGTPTVKLDLKSKQAGIPNMPDHITVWIDPARAVSMKQQFFDASGDTRTVTYSNVKCDVKLPKGVFDIPKAKNVIPQ